MSPVTPADYVAPAMTDNVTQLNKTNMQAWLQGAGSQADNRCKVIEEGPINIEYFGAVAGAANSGPQIQAACDAYPYGADIMIPPGKLFNTTQIINPGTETTIDVRGRLRAMGSVDGLAAILDFSIPGNKGRGGGVKGHGRLLGNRVAHNLVFVNSWHGASFKDFACNDQVYAGIYFKANATPPSGGAAGSGDCDGNKVDHVMHYHEGSAGVGLTTTLRPMRFIVFEGGGGAGAGCSDNSVEGNSYVSDGLAEATAGGGWIDGGYGIEVINASRIRIKDFGCFDNTRFYSGAVLIRITSAAGGAQTACVVEDLYAESQASGPPAGWINAAVTIRTETTSTLATTDHTIYGLKMASTAGTNARRLWCDNKTTTSPTGKISYVGFKDPRGRIGAAGQILLDAGTSNTLIQTMGAELGNISPVTAVNGNKYVNVLA